MPFIEMGLFVKKASVDYDGLHLAISM